MDRLARELAEREPSLPGWARLEASRRALGDSRAELSAGRGGGGALERAAAIARELARPRPARVVNATGVVLHTNLGRAPIAPGAARAAAEAAAAYSDLELDLASGERGDRYGALGVLLRLLSGAGGAFAVNNCAAAVLLALHTLARGREVVVSRGELVEIGGSFRVPEILRQAGVRLVEVGTTNRTHAHDYEEAIGADTAVLLKVHRSNFEQRGFVAEVPLAELVAIGRRRGVPVVEDLGSGTLVDLRARGLPPESYAPARLETGVDLVCFSGDKLLGGPQAGLVLGDAAVVERLRKDPLARALRPGKMTLAALDWTLRALLEGRHEELPALRMLNAPADALAARAQALAARLRESAPPALGVAVEPVRAPVGGGSLPGFELASHAVALRAPAGAARLVEALRRAPVPVLARVAEGRALLDVRTLLPGEEADVERAVRALRIDEPERTAATEASRQ